MQVIIIGNGITGATAAFELRARQPEWEITIISGESDYFYSRPALMYLWLGHMSLEDTRPYANADWDRLRIRRVEAWVEGVNTDQRRVRLANGQTLEFDKLLIATGSKPNKFGWPGQDLDGVQGFYSLQDLQLLEQNGAGIERAVIVGGGLIGVELAEMFHARGIEVIILAREHSYWDNVLPKAESAILGIQQRYFSRFRITTNGGQCISCGNCSTYCEMGIDVRSYARRGANIVRASCVGCGICSAVCPRGVLNLEGGKTHKERFPGADQPLKEFIRSLRS